MLFPESYKDEYLTLSILLIFFPQGGFVKI